MQIQHLRLKNFRGFELFELDFHPEVTLLVGRNGSGKTGVLEGLAVAMGAWFAGMATLKSQDRTIQSSDTRLSRLNTAGLPTLEPSYPVVVEATGTVAGVDVAWTRELRHPDGRTTWGGTRELSELAAAVEQEIASGEVVELPVIAYYTAGRLWVQKRDRDRGGLGSRLDGYTAALEVASDPKRFEAWMAWREEDRIQRMAEANEQGKDLKGVRSPQLEAVQEAARGCLEGAKRFYYSANHRELRVEFDDGTQLPYDCLSDGQRSLVAMAADIAWRCAQLNPFFGAEAAQKTKGVVLIDEIELHLHPAWQRRVLADLRRTFPQIQIVATTHSPLVIGAAKRDWIRPLKSGEPRAFGVGHVEGRDINAILRELMGVGPRPERTQQAITAVEQALECENVAGARELLEQLREQLGEHDEAVQSLDWELRDLEVNGA